MLILAAVFVVSLGLGLSTIVEYRAGETSYDEAREVASVPDFEDVTATEENKTDPYLAALSHIDFAALRDVNPDVFGWITIPGTKINYPLVQGEDNSLYLTHTWKGEANSSGAVFLDCGSNKRLSDFHSVLYGHRMRNGSMFAALKYYTDRSFWEQHRYIYVSNGTACYKYAIFAAWEASVYGDAYTLYFADDADKQSYIDECLAASAYSTGIYPSPEDHLLTLSTCTGRGYSTRWIVQAVRVDE